MAGTKVMQQEPSATRFHCRAAVLIGRTAGLARPFVRLSAVNEKVWVEQHKNACERSIQGTNNRCANLHLKTSKVRRTAAQYVGTEPA